MRGGQLAASLLPDGGLQVFAISPKRGTLYTAQQPKARGTWTAFARFSPYPCAPFFSICAAYLPDGRIQLWIADDVGGTADTTWQETTAPDAAWVSWAPFALPVESILLAAGNLIDGRMQVFAGNHAVPNQMFQTGRLRRRPTRPLPAGSYSIRSRWITRRNPRAV
jgi:hypothetical protein